MVFSINNIKQLLVQVTSSSFLLWFTSHNNQCYETSDFMQKDIVLNVDDGSSKTITLQIWDTSGMERFNR